MRQGCSGEPPLFTVANCSQQEPRGGNGAEVAFSLEFPVVVPGAAAENGTTLQKIRANMAWFFVLI